MKEIRLLSQTQQTRHAKLPHQSKDTTTAILRRAVDAECTESVTTKFRYFWMLVQPVLGPFEKKSNPSDWSLLSFSRTVFICRNCSRATKTLATPPSAIIAIKVCSCVTQLSGRMLSAEEDNWCCIVLVMTRVQFVSDGVPLHNEALAFSGMFHLVVRPRVCYWWPCRTSDTCCWWVF
jgi:hypothetical protein